MNPNETQLSDIYQPLLESVVVEIITPAKTKAGVVLPDSVKEELRKKLNPSMRVVAIGKDVKTVKVGEWILPSPDGRPHQILLLHKDPNKGVAHIQLHITEILGIVDRDFAIANVEHTSLEVN